MFRNAAKSAVMLALASALGCATTVTDQMAAIATDTGNELAAFTPTLTFKTDRWNRHVPMLYATTPWGQKGLIQFEVPEYVHGRAPGDKRSGFLFSGRPLDVAAKLGGVRYKSLEKPAWREIPGGLALDTPLSEGLTIRFRVLARDRMLEVRWGLTNAGEKPIHNCWAQICFKGWAEPTLAERLPTSSWMLSRGKLISWDGAGQDLSWIPKERREDGRFNRSCFFRAKVGSGPTRGHIRLTPPEKAAIFRLARKVDIPAIAKADAAKRRAAIVYSPSAPSIFYNYFQPCFHADPFLGTVPAGATRWTSTYLIFFEGDVKAFMHKLAATHKSIVESK